MRIAIGVGLALLVASCSKQVAPETQLQFVRDYQAVRAEWRTARDRNNDLQINRAEDKARAFFSTSAEVVDWVGEVDSVNTLFGKTSAIVVKHDGIKYHLFPEGEQPVFATLESGERVRFSGTRRTELSVTMIGAMTDPEISVKPLKAISRE